jgi:translation initiation factor 1A
MYQTSIRNKKKFSQFNKVTNNNYIIEKEYEVYACVIKLLGNCRAQVLCDDGNETIGIIRGSLRRFNKRVLIESGDIVVVSKRDFQDNKVDIVHKYNLEQCKILINDKELSDTLINAYNKVNINTINNTNDANIIFEDTNNEDTNNEDYIKKKEKDDYSNSVFVFNSEDEVEDEDNI